MVSLHIEHAVTDFDTWRSVFDAFAVVRRRGGVTRERIARPVDDPRYVVVELEFDAVEPAQAFLAFLLTEVWANPETSPALVGTPRAAVLETA